jgi:hypothetical protein
VYRHLNQFGGSLQLQVDVFCDDICSGVEAWLATVHGNVGVMQRVGELLSIHSPQSRQ